MDAQTTLVGIAMASGLTATILSLFKFYRDIKETRKRREAEEFREFQAERRTAVAGGRALGRSYAMAQYALQSAVAPVWVGTTSTTQSGALTQLDLQRAYDMMQQSQPREPQMVVQARMIEEIKSKERRNRAKRDAEELNKQLNEPFWAWHERKENETKRVRVNDIAGRCADSGIQFRDIANGHFSDAMAYSVWGSRVAEQSPDRQDAESMGMDAARLEAGGDQPDHGQRDGGSSLPFHMGY